MISTNIQSIKKDILLNKKLQKAIDFINNNNLEEIEAGVYEIENQDLFAQVIDFETNDLKNIKAESHKKYIDMQYLVNGEEILGYKVNDGTYIADQYIEDRDIFFYDSNISNISFSHATKGCINIYFPDDIHLPGIKVNESKKVRKIVFKIKVELFNTIN